MFLIVRLRKLWVEEKGQDIVVYAVMLAVTVLRRLRNWASEMLLDWAVPERYQRGPVAGRLFAQPAPTAWEKIGKLRNRAIAGHSESSCVRN